MGDAYALRPVCCGLAEGNGSRTRFRAVQRSQRFGGTRTPGWVRTHPPEGGRARPGLLWANRGVGRMTRASRLRLPGKSGPAKGNVPQARFRAAPRRQHFGGTRTPGGCERTRLGRAGASRSALGGPAGGSKDRGKTEYWRHAAYRRYRAAKGNGPRARFRAPRRRQHAGGTRPPGWVRTRPPRGGRARPGLLCANRGVHRITAPARRPAR